MGVPWSSTLLALPSFISIRNSRCVQVEGCRYTSFPNEGTLSLLCSGNSFLADTFSLNFMLLRKRVPTGWLTKSPAVVMVDVWIISPVHVSEDLGTRLFMLCFMSDTRKFHVSHSKVPWLISVVHALPCNTTCFEEFNHWITCFGGCIWDYWT